MSLTAANTEKTNILVFSNSVEFRHDAIPSAVKTFVELGEEQKWNLTFTEDSTWMRDDVLVDTEVVIFLLSTGDFLNEEQRASFKKFMQSGGGFVGLHSGATDSLGKWKWFRKMVGARFSGHPPVCDMELNIENANHPATRCFGGELAKWTDEIYSFDRSPREEVEVLVSVNEQSYDTSNNPWFEGVELAMGDHPLVWCREFEGGRMIQSALGHRKELYELPMFRQHLVGLVDWALGDE